MQVFVIINDGLLFSIWAKEGRQLIGKIIERKVLMHPEDYERFKIIDLKEKYKMFSDRQLANLEVEIYKLSLSSPEAFQKIMDVLEYNNSDAFFSIQNLIALIKDRKSALENLVAEYFKILKEDEPIKYQNILEELKNDTYILDILSSHT